MAKTTKEANNMYDAGITLGGIAIYLKFFNLEPRLFAVCNLISIRIRNHITWYSLSWNLLMSYATCIHQTK